MIGGGKTPDYRLYSVYVSDRFSDIGLVGVIAIRGHTLDLLSLSCWALGREVERHMMAFVKKDEVKSIDIYQL